MRSPGDAESTAEEDGNDEFGAKSSVNMSEKLVKRPLQPLSRKKVEDYNYGLKKRGVVYLSRVPPFMKPAKVKQLMEQHGIVTRVSVEGLFAFEAEVNGPG